MQWRICSSVAVPQHPTCGRAAAAGESLGFTGRGRFAYHLARALRWRRFDAMTIIGLIVAVLLFKHFARQYRYYQRQLGDDPVEV